MMVVAAHRISAASTAVHRILAVHRTLAVHRISVVDEMVDLGP